MKVPPLEELPIAVRAFAVPAKDRPIGPSEFALIFDTETTVDAAQQLRVGAYQFRQMGELKEAGLFYDPDSLTMRDVGVVQAYAQENDLVVRTDREFVDEVFFSLAYERNALIVGFNLPFDISRLALGHESARGRMRGGFTFKLSEDNQQPNVQVRHLNARSALIQFAAQRRQQTSRSMRGRGRRVPVRRGHFCDLKSLGAALTGQSHTLRSLAKLLGTPHQKTEEEHGGPITPEYLDYTTNDVQVTWECFERLLDTYQGYGLTETPVSRIYSEASIGKAYLRQMGIIPWRRLQPEFPPSVLGIIMGTYYGGRSEVHLRRVLARVLHCDFLSMYPTVCTLMGLWRFVTAQGIDYEDTTEEARSFLDQVTPQMLQKTKTWRDFPVLVQVQPSADLFPVRAAYGDDPQYSIGLNFLTSDRPLWYTLADCVASKLLTGRPPTVLRAVRFRPLSPQEGLRPADVAGNPAFRVDPYKQDFYRRVVELRSQVKAAKKRADQVGDEASSARLDAEQMALKITANATSYGIFVELNVTQEAGEVDLTCFGYTSEGFPTTGRSVEEPGSFFHPLLATLITGGARLMLAVVEHLTLQEGLSWALCDTDSMALARPEEMDDSEFLERASRIQKWFAPLSPYEDEPDLFGIEDANYRLDSDGLSSELDPLFCLAVSPKRYCMLNFTAGGPAIRKASAHGLGHLRPPYEESDAPPNVPSPVVPLDELEVERWEHDLWHRIVEAALGPHPEQVRLDDLPGFDKPAVSRYAATTPRLLRWFWRFNNDRPYREQVRPFGFLLAFQADPIKSLDLALPRAVAPYDRDPAVAVGLCFDRETGDAVSSDELKTYRRALAQYHLHPDEKFRQADYLDVGLTSRRHISVWVVEHIGKEANRWEEQLYLGEDPQAQIVYGLTPQDAKRLRTEEETRESVVLEAVRRRVDESGLRRFAAEARIDPGHLSRVLAGERRLTAELVVKLEEALGL